jgi:hypothetical protein
VPTPCPGPCNNVWRRAEQPGTEPDLQPAWGHPTQCDACVTHARRRLTELPELLTAVHLEALHATPAPAASSIHTRTSSAPTWPGQAARLLLDHIIGSMETLAADIHELRGLRAHYTAAGYTTTHEGTRINHTVARLNTHLDWAMQHHPAAGEPHDRDGANPAGQIRAWHTACLTFTARTPYRAQKAAPCPRCSLRTLSRGDGEDYIACRNPACELLLTQAEYDQHAAHIHAVQVAA